MTDDLKTEISINSDDGSPVVRLHISIDKYVMPELLKEMIRKALTLNKVTYNVYTVGNSTDMSFIRIDIVRAPDEDVEHTDKTCFTVIHDIIDRVKNLSKSYPEIKKTYVLV